MPDPDQGGGEQSEDALRDEAEWGERADSEPRWPASLAVAAAVALYVVLPERLITGLGPRFLVPSLEGVLGVSLLIASPRRISRESVRLRAAAIVLIALVNLANLVSLVELVNELLSAHPPASLGGRTLIVASVPVWLTNVLVFALWYWELDRGGPAARSAAAEAATRLSVPTDDRACGHVAGLVADVPRLPVHLVHQRHRLQPHRHHAAHGVGEDPDDAAVAGVVDHGGARRVARRQHPQVSAPRLRGQWTRLEGSVSGARRSISRRYSGK